MASYALLVAMPVPVATRELVSNLSISLLPLIQMYLHCSEDTYHTLEDSSLYL